MPILVDGLPNTASAATRSETSGGIGLVKPITGNGTEAMTSMIAAPCE